MRERYCRGSIVSSEPEKKDAPLALEETGRGRKQAHKLCCCQEGSLAAWDSLVAAFIEEGGGGRGQLKQLLRARGNSRQNARCYCSSKVRVQSPTVTSIGTNNTKLLKVHIIFL